MASTALADAATSSTPVRAVPPRGLRLIALGVGFAVGALCLQLFVWLAFSPFAGGTAYALGAMLGLGSQALLGVLLALPVLGSDRRVTRALVLGLFALAFAVLAAGYHYHAAFNRLPTLSMLAALRDPGMLTRSLDAALPLPVWLGEALAPALLALACMGPLARLLERVRARLGTLGAWLAPLLVVSSLGLPRLLHGQAYFGSVHPLVHLLSAHEPATRTHGAPTPDGPMSAKEAMLAARATVLARVGAHGGDSEPVDPAYPYCRESSGARAKGNAEAPSIVFLLLEGISRRELYGSYQGKPLMPELSRIARDGLELRRFQAVGDRSSQALFSLLAGVPPETHRRIVSNARLVRFQGLARAFAEAGYSTLYFHGSDLSFEQQRALVRRGGFERLIEPSPAELEHVTGWGLTDRQVLAFLRDEVTKQRASEPARPYLATVATLTTHDPYFVPEEHARVFEGSDPYARFADTARYLDRELGAFYRWYLEQEKARGTVLVMVSDHAPRLPTPGDPTDTSTGELEYRFEVPLLMFGRPIDALPNRTEIAARVGTHADLGATLLQLAGIAQPACSVGVSLLSNDFPKQRWAVSLAGDNLEYLFVHAPPLRYMLPLDGRPPRLYDLDRDPLLRKDLWNERDGGWPAVRTFVDAYLRLGAYLNLGDHFAPPEGKPLERKVSAAPAEPLRIISHRGNTQGASAPIDAPENSTAAFDRAIARGFAWIELDLQLTADGAAVVAHDPVLKDKLGQPVALLKLSLSEARARGLGELPTLSEVLERYAGRANFAVEIKPQVTWLESTRLVRAALAAIAARPRGMRIVVDSFSHGVAASVRQFSDVEVGWDAPQKPYAREWLDLFREHGFHWVYLRHELATPEAIADFHALGVKVMLYTLDDRAALARFGEHLPDGVITDSASWLE